MHERPAESKYYPRGVLMTKKRKKRPEPPRDMRMEPEKRVTPKFDDESIALYRVADRESMGFRVLDNCAEENIQ